MAELVPNWDKFNVTEVPLFELTDNAKWLKLDEKFVKSAIDKHNKAKDEKWFLPTVFIWHNNDNDEKEAVWFFDNIRLVGKQVFVDFVDFASEFQEKLRKFPYRSMEVIGWEITGIALLGSNSPFFKSAPLSFKYDNSDEKCTVFFGDKFDLLPESPDSTILSTNNDNMDVEKVKAEMTTQFAKDKAEIEAKYSKELAEKDQMIAEREAEYTKLKEKVTFAECSESVAQLSKKGVTFSNKENEDAVATFASSLTDEQRTAFFDLLSKVRSVNFDKLGDDSDPEEVWDKEDDVNATPWQSEDEEELTDEKAAELEEEAQEYAKANGVKLHVALEQVYRKHNIIK